MLKQNKKILIIFVFIIINICFIFGQSLASADASNMLSSKFQLLFEGIVASLFNFAVDLCYFTRKLAHFVEFFVLGVLTFTNILIIRKEYQKSYVGCGLFFVLLIAVTDEFIQSFTGRTSSVKDVLIDFSGAAFGLLTVILFTFLKRKMNSGEKTNAKRKK